jgi:hypothetical protein
MKKKEDKQVEQKEKKLPDLETIEISKTTDISVKEIQTTEHATSIETAATIETTDNVTFKDLVRLVMF